MRIARDGRQREHSWMIISQQHARALRGAGVGDGGSGVHGTLYSRFWKSPILSKLKQVPRANFKVAFWSEFVENN
jgi:hypothetical protein